MSEIDMTLQAAPVLRQGDQEPWVRYLKQLLEHVGEEPGPINESFDGPTRRAVVSFQSKHDELPESGVVETPTWKWLLWRSEDKEQVDSVVGQEFGEMDKLDPGGEVGRSGWCNVTFQCTISDHFHAPIPDAHVHRPAVSG